ncbi:hypothetical protein LEM8419_02220 [Neolewinella maritima]|uniref:PH domain-containing protein n=1 Tax=Neolewinella maritima TaxID=1383882 RepID=A0ABM9B343_9BACT|nr:hypothetical protein [Neolewinella maritima]CAH1001319.1 hypothetical protein LEM8419_02220 [Neolewinella maritima]
MNRQPPYKLIPDVGSIALVVFVLIAYSFLPGQVPDWAFGLAWFVAALIMVGTVTELFLLYRDYKAGILFPMRNASLFVLLATVVGMPLYLIYTSVRGDYLGPSTLLLIPVFFTLVLRNLFRVRLDMVSLQAKTGFRGPTEVPLFKIEDVAVTDDRITISATGKRPIQLLRVFFFSEHWQALVAKLSAYRN